MRYVQLLAGAVTATARAGAQDVHTPLLGLERGLRETDMSTQASFFTVSD